MIKGESISKESIIIFNEIKNKIPREILKNSSVVFYNNKIIKFRGYPSLIGDEIDFNVDDGSKVSFPNSNMKSRLLESKLLDQTSIVSFVSDKEIIVYMNYNNLDEFTNILSRVKWANVHTNIKPRLILC